ncbi:MAG: hypothetical protein U0869_24030 [Chloroflexota bacterium]
MSEHERDTATQHDPLLPPGGDETPSDAGGYIGHEPELARETIPDGVRRGDVRVSGVATQPTGSGARAHTSEEGSGGPDGHRQGSTVSDDQLREAGQDR